MKAILHVTEETQSNGAVELFSVYNQFFATAPPPLQSPPPPPPRTTDSARSSCMGMLTIYHRIVLPGPVVTRAAALKIPV